MKRTFATAAVLCGALALPTGAVAQEPSPENFKNGAKYCKALRAASGESNFRSMFGGGKNAYGKCVSKAARTDQKQEKQAKENAAQECKAEREADPVAFKTTYGTNENGKNAFGKCVSKKAKENKAELDAQEKQKVNAAKECRAEQKADPAAFRTTYGTNENGKNAFGKCVSKKAKAKQDGQPAQT